MTVEEYMWNVLQTYEMINVYVVVGRSRNDLVETNYGVKKTTDNSCSRRRKQFVFTTLLSAIYETKKQ